MIDRLSSRSSVRQLVLTATVAALAAAFIAAPTLADSATFRGPDRDGLFQAEGLAQSWPENGPTELWAATGLGEGYASLAI